MSHPFPVSPLGRLIRCSSADWMKSKVHALTLPKAAADAGKPFNLMNLDAALETALGTDKVKIEDIAPRFGTDEVYVAATVGAKEAAAILRVKADGSVHRARSCGDAGVRSKP